MKPNLEELRRLAEKHKEIEDEIDFAGGDWDEVKEYVRKFNPQTVLALLDEIEAIQNIMSGLIEDVSYLTYKRNQLIEAAHKIDMKYMRKDFWPLKEVLEQYDETSGVNS